MSWHPTLGRLRDVLAGLYARSQDIRRILDDAGMGALTPLSPITAIDAWHTVLTSAHNQRHVESIVTIALREYAQDEELREADRAYNVWRGACEDADEREPLAVAAAKRRFSMGRLPTPADPDLFVGRDEAIRLLDGAWKRGKIHIVQFVADGGVGKSTIIWNWVEQLRRRDFPDCVQAIDWSFYSQGRRDYATDSQKFLLEAARHFTDLGVDLGAGAATLPDQMGRLIGDAFVACGGLMILDGVEPLQYAPQENGGALKDPGLAALLTQIRGAPPPGLGAAKRLLILSTRWQLPELRSPQRGPIRRVDLNTLSDEQGARLLMQFRLPDAPSRKLYFVPPNYVDQQYAVHEEFKACSQEYDGHALALILLASYLLNRHNGDLARRRDVSAIPLDHEDDPYRHARRVMRSYDRMFEEGSAASGSGASLSRACAETLRLVGLFDRPAPSDLLDVLRRGDPIPGLTDAVQDDARFEEAVRQLSALRLLAGGFSAHDGSLDAHPLVREHFSQLVQAKYAAAWSAAHVRLYDHLRAIPEELPETIERMDYLFQAVVHACKAGRYHDALHQLYYPRIMRGEVRYAAEELGAMVPLLSILSHFFQGGEWGRFFEPRADRQPLTDDEQIELLMQSGEYLTATRGYATQEVERTFRPAVELCRKRGDNDRLIRASYGLWRFALVRGDLRRAQGIAAELKNLAGAGSARNQLESERVQCTTSFYLAHFADAVTHGDIGYRLYVDVDGADAHQNELAVTCLSYGALALWHMGQSADALSRAEKSLGLARAEGHAHSLAMALFISTVLRHCCRQTDEAVTQADELIAVSSRNGLSFWLAAGISMKGRALAERAFSSADSRAAADAALSEMRRGLDLWKTTGARLVLPFWLGQLADIEIRLAATESHATRATRAARLVNQALRQAETSGERWWEPELLRLNGALLGLQGQAIDRVTAVVERAVTSAEQLNSRALRLRALSDLYRVHVLRPPDSTPATSVDSKSLKPGAEEAARKRLYDAFRLFAHEPWMTEVREVAMLLGLPTDHSLTSGELSTEPKLPASDFG
jgi:hypothetical protein